MARSPYTGVPTVQPAGPPGNDYQNITPFPGAFGGVEAGALRQGGAEIERGADEATQAAIIQQQRFNDHAVTDAVNQLQTRAEALTYGDSSDPSAPRGLYSLKGYDAMKAGPQVSQQINQVRDDITGGLQNDAQRLSFQQQTTRYLQYKRAEIASHIDRESTQYGINAETAAISAAGTIAGNNYASDENVGSALKDAMLHGSKQAILTYGHPPGPDAPQEEQDNYRNLMSQQGRKAAGYVVQRAVMGAQAADPINGAARGAEILDKFGSLIDPDMRETLRAHVASKADDAAVAGVAAGIPITGGTAPRAPIGADSSARAASVRDGLIARGLDKDTATAFAANALHESDANPQTGPGDGGAAHGLFMWRDDRLKAFQDTHGGLLPEQTSLDTQLDFAMSELRGSEAPAMAGIEQANGPAGKAAAVSTLYLRPKDTVAEEQRRGATATQLAGTAPGPPSPQQTAPAQHNAAPFSAEADVMADTRARAHAAFPNRPDLAERVIRQKWEEIQQTNLLEAKFEAEQQKAKRDAEEAWGMNIMTTLRSDPTKFDPGMVWSTQGAGASIDWEKREQMSRVVEYQLSQAGVPNTAPYGQGYSNVFKSITAGADGPDAVHSMRDIWSRAGPGGDLTLLGASKLSEVFNMVHKNPDEAGVRVLESSMLDYAKGQLWKPVELAGIKNQAGLNRYNGQFVPSFISGFEKWRDQHPDNPFGYLNQDTVDKLLAPLRLNPTQEALERLSETGGQLPGQQEPEGTPMPAPPPGVNANEWNSIGTSRPFSTNGQSYTHMAWAQVLTRLMSDPDKFGPDFDRYFGPSGYRASDIVSRLKGSIVTPAAITQQGAATAPGGATFVPTPVPEKRIIQEWHQAIDQIPKENIDELLKTPDGRARVDAAGQYVDKIWEALTLHGSSEEGAPHRRGVESEQKPADRAIENPGGAENSEHKIIQDWHRVIENIPQDDIDALSRTPEGRARIAVANHYIGEVWRALTSGGPQNGSEPTQQQTTVGGAGVR